MPPNNRMANELCATGGLPPVPAIKDSAAEQHTGKTSAAAKAKRSTIANLRIMRRSPLRICGPIRPHREALFYEGPTVVANIRIAPGRLFRRRKKTAPNEINHGGTE